VIWSEAVLRYLRPGVPRGGSSSSSRSGLHCLPPSYRRRARGLCLRTRLSGSIYHAHSPPHHSHGSSQRSLSLRFRNSRGTLRSCVSCGKRLHGDIGCSGQGWLAWRGHLRRAAIALRRKSQMRSHLYLQHVGFCTDSTSPSKADRASLNWEFIASPLPDSVVPKTPTIPPVSALACPRRWPRDARRSPNPRSARQGMRPRRS